MSELALDDLERARLDWPEPVLIDVIADSYRAGSNDADVAAPARLHARFLCDLVEGEARALAFLRLELIACCAARGIGVAAIEAADHAAFRELINIVEARFRTSPRLRLLFTRRLYVALRRLPTRSEPTQPAAPVRVLAMARGAAGRLPMKVAANG